MTGIALLRIIAVFIFQWLQTKPTRRVCPFDLENSTTHWQELWRNPPQQLKERKQIDHVVYWMWWLMG